MESGLDAFAFFTKIGHMSDDVEDHIAGMKVACGIGVVFCIV